MSGTVLPQSSHGTSSSYSFSVTASSSKGIGEKLRSITAEQTNAIAKGIASTMMNFLQIDLLGNLPVEGQYNVSLDGTKSPVCWPTYASNSSFLKIATPIIEDKILRALSTPENVARNGIEFLFYNNSEQQVFENGSPCGLFQVIKEKYHDPDKIEAGIQHLINGYKMQTLKWVKVMRVEQDPSTSELVFHIQETWNGNFVGHSRSTIEKFESDARNSTITI